MPNPNMHAMRTKRLSISNLHNQYKKEQRKYGQIGQTAKVAYKKEFNTLQPIRYFKIWNEYVIKKKNIQSNAPIDMSKKQDIYFNTNITDTNSINTSTNTSFQPVQNIIQTRSRLKYTDIKTSNNFCIAKNTKIREFGNSILSLNRTV